MIFLKREYRKRKVTVRNTVTILLLLVIFLTNLYSFYRYNLGSCFGSDPYEYKNYDSSYNKSSYNTNYKSVAYSADSERVIFYRKTYTYLALALLAFILVETSLLRLVPAMLIKAMFGGKFIWLFSGIY